MAAGLPRLKDNIFYGVKQILIYWHIVHFKTIALDRVNRIYFCFVSVIIPSTSTQIKYAK
jgi:hypothetical protein